MKVIILGSGVLGITTAYVLAARGHEVTVIERNAESSAEGSHSNGGQMSYCHAEPWPSPATLRKLPGWLMREDSPLFFRPRADLGMVRWGLGFLMSSTNARVQSSTRAILALGLYSRAELEKIRAATKLEFAFQSRGILHIYSNEYDQASALRQFEFQAAYGSKHKIVSADEVRLMEPALIHAERPIIGGIHMLLDETGDALAFSLALQKICADMGVRFHFNEHITRLNADRNIITSVTTNKDTYQADAYVLAAGPYSNALCRNLGFSLPVYPMKGYSITARANEFSPLASITDTSHKIVYTRLGDSVRVAGTAELTGYDTSLNEKRLAPILRFSRMTFPKMDWDHLTGRWACLRPSTPDGPPILGRSPVSNLFLNTGHGTLGWTQAAGSAALVADIIEDKTPEIPVAPYGLKRRT